MSDSINWNKLSDVERIKYDSNYLRGSLVESLENPLTGALADDDTQLSKFHGIYQQHDRDIEKDRKKSKLEPGYSFLIRIRLPGGISTAEQWRAMDDISSKWANNTLKLTTRQAFQLHGVLKKDLKKTIQGFNSVLLDSIAACGDVNRNVMATPAPYASSVHEDVDHLAKAISSHLTPQTRAYHEIWLDEKLVAGGKPEVIEPIYGDRYLPRKFKIGISIPPFNDIDVYSQDLGLIAIEKDGKLEGFNVTIGGGFGSTFGREDTYPRLGSAIGFITPNQAVDVSEKIMLVQKENGNRQDRKLSRFKYTIDRLGVDAVKKLIEGKLGYQLLPERAFKFERNGDAYGWHKSMDGKWFLTLFVEGGRVKDTENYTLKTALREIANLNICDFRLTGNQNLILGDINTKSKKRISQILERHGILPNPISGLRRNSIACVSFNTCSLAFAEAERYLPSLITKIEDILSEVGLMEDEIVIRMTGCPNGCGRPYLGEIGLIGRSLGHYNLYLGAGFVGDRLNSLYKETLSEAQILSELRPLITDYANERNKGERFGDFIIRKGVVKEIKEGREFKH